MLERNSFIGKLKNYFISAKKVLWESMKAAYQVIWAADTLSNIAIVMPIKPELNPFKVGNEFLQLARGERLNLSASCRKV